MSKPNCGIYKIVNLINNDCYIGQSIDLEKRKYIHFRLLKLNKSLHRHLQNAYNLYGVENFKFEIILYCEPFELTRYEQGLVDRLKPVYNICIECVDSCKGIKRSIETRVKMSKLQEGRTYSEETIK